MFVRSILSSYSKLLAGASLALLAIALAGCNETVAQKAPPSRPVLVATAAAVGSNILYEAILSFLGLVGRQPSFDG